MKAREGLRFREKPTEENDPEERKEEVWCEVGFGFQAQIDNRRDDKDCQDDRGGGEPEPLTPPALNPKP